jgi:arginase
MTGQENASQSLRDAGLVQNLESCGFDVTDMGDLTKVPFKPDTKNPKQQNLQDVLCVIGEVAYAVHMAIQNRAWPLVIGGDCSVSIGVLAALINHFPSLGLYYLDGDVDLNTPETTHTGMFDGMVMSHILGRGADELRNFGARCPLLDEPQIALFGYSLQAGGVDTAEIESLNESRMAKYPLEEIVADVEAAAKGAVRELESNASHFLVHFDVDVIDYDDFPAVDVPHRPGLALSQAKKALNIFTGSPSTVGLVVAEFNANQDVDGSLARRLADTIAGAMVERL